MAKKVVIDPGHGGEDGGAEYKGRLEKIDNLNMAKTVKAIVESHGVTVVMTRTNDAAVSLQGRCDISNNAKADLFLSIHRNASEPEQAKGIETFSLTESGTGRTLSANIQNEILAVGVNANRGLKTANYYVLKNTNAPAALVEIGFIDNTKDNSLFDAKFNEYAIAIAKGILKTIGIAYVGKTSKPTIPSGPRQLGKGDNGEDVKALQVKLNSLNYKLTADGDFGPATDAAVRNFQSKYSELAPVDGIVGTKTMNKLIAIIAEMNKPKPTVEVWYRVMIDGKNIEANRTLADSTAVVKRMIDAGEGTIGQVQRSTGGDILFNYTKAPVKPSEPKPVPKPEPIKEIFAVKHKLMDKSEATREQFKQFFKNQNKEYKLTCSINEWVDTAFEEAEKEGIRADVVICQAIHETGYFQYGGDVKPEQNNFAGIGAIGGGAAGQGFPDAKTGIRAQVQHLKAYASNEHTTQAIVDPRFNLVARAIAPTLEDLGGRWAQPGYDVKKYSSFEEAVKNNDSYGQMIYSLVSQVKATVVKAEEVKPPVTPIVPKLPEKPVVVPPKQTEPTDVELPKGLLEAIVEFVKKLIIIFSKK